MTHEQVYNLVNQATTEILGEVDVLKEDLTNVVDIGTSILNANAMDEYVRSLVNHIGKVIFVNRPYRGNVPSVLMDGWEFGSICEKISGDLPDATENETWSLEDGQSYDPNIFYKPSVEAKFFNKRTTFEIPMSFTERQVKQSFSNAEQLNAFISMLYNEIEKAMTVKVDALIMRTIDNMIGETVYDEMPAGTYTGTSVKAVNLLYLYNQRFSKNLSAVNSITDPDFIRFAVYTIGMYEKRLSKISKLFNVGGKARFTPAELMHIVLHSDFMASAGVYLYSDVYHNEFVALPNAESVPYWQGSGDDYAFTETSKIDITTASGHDISFTGIIGVMFDRDALGVTNMNKRVTTNYNAKAEFFNNWYKSDAGYFNDLNENFVVFYVA